VTELRAAPDNSRSCSRCRRAMAASGPAPVETTEARLIGGSGKACRYSRAAATLSTVVPASAGTCCVV